jgi:hypothetical protein
MHANDQRSFKMLSVRRKGREREKSAQTEQKRIQKLQGKTGIYKMPQNPPSGDGDFVCFFGKSTIDNLPL